ncbi:alpha/beta fold hydrolase [uncultured Roseobacter sp.]|uniref:alpha/beta fold hydrolase n=1 Tax=uncultured Roseobacter sp. TaxID=114847 RepID=UPI002624A0B1|nr:alpha/beta fold hydrolase [uncultured Roseobacter sp.]
MKTLVLVHGFMGGSAQWDAQAAHFGDRYNVFAPDLPGFGANRHLPVLHSISAFADWVIGELRRNGIKRYHLLGHSMGGMIVQEMTRKDQDNIDRLVLYGTGAIGVLPGRFETIEQSKARALADGARVTARRIAATWFLDHQQDPAFESCAAIAENASRDAIQAGLDAMQAWRGDDFLPSITPETLVLWGDGDRTYQWQQAHQLWETIPRSNLAVVPNCAHAVHLEMPEVFNLLVSGFLAREGE